MSASPYLTSEAVAARLHCSLRVVHELARLRRIPHRRLPGTRRCLFREDELLAWEDGAALEIVELEGDGRIVVSCRRRRDRLQKGACPARASRYG